MKTRTDVRRWKIKWCSTLLGYLCLSVWIFLSFPFCLSLSLFDIHTHTESGLKVHISWAGAASAAHTSEHMFNICHPSIFYWKLLLLITGFQVDWCLRHRDVNKKTIVLFLYSPHARVRLKPSHFSHHVDSCSIRRFHFLMKAESNFLYVTEAFHSLVSLPIRTLSQWVNYTSFRRHFAICFRLTQ